MKNKYRIVTDNYLGYEAQVQYPLIPIWFSLGINTFKTIEETKAYIDSQGKHPSFKSKFVCYHDKK